MQSTGQTVKRKTFVENLGELLTLAFTRNKSQGEAVRLVEVTHAVTDPLSWVVAGLGLALTCGRILWIYFWHHSAGQFLDKWIVAGWVIVPPVWFWLEWLMFPTNAIEKKRSEWENMVQGHDVCRNMWLAAVVVFAMLLKVQPGGL